MISIDEFQNIRQKRHLIVLDTNILLELYRQPANISLDIINALKQIKDTLYVPRQVLNEYLRNYQEICGKERKRYQKVNKELSSSVKKLEEEISSKINEYRKHNYTDISKLQSDLIQKSKEIQEVIDNFDKEHQTEIQLNIDFLENDRVKEFVDFLVGEGKIGGEIPFSQKLLIIQEGQIRFSNLLPPGYMDGAKEGIDKYGDLFVWKSILAVAKEQNTDIIFVCNDLKEDWWEKDKETPIELRRELREEFREINPFLNVHFLNLEKFFTYLSEELHIGMSKSALQLSAMDDVKVLLNKYNDTIEEKIAEILCSINIEAELDEEFLESGDEKIYWSVRDVSVDKEGRSIFYYVKLDISVLADLTFCEPGNYPYPAGTVAMAFEGKITLETEEYATESTLKLWEVELSEIQHIEPDEWRVLSRMGEGKSCKELIVENKELKKYNESRRKASRPNMMNASGAVYGVQEFAKALQEVSDGVSTTGMETTMQILSKQIEPVRLTSQMVGPSKGLIEMAKPLSQVAITAESLNQMAKPMVQLNQIAQSVNPLQ